MGVSPHLRHSLTGARLLRAALTPPVPLPAAGVLVNLHGSSIASETSRAVRGQGHDEAPPPAGAERGRSRQAGAGPRLLSSMYQG